MPLRGVLPPAATPFRGDEVDLRALRVNVARWLRAPVAGLVVLGSNGEAPLLDEHEADAVIDAARSEVPPDRVFIVGTGRESTRATIAACRRAAALGADLVLVRTPAFFKGQMSAEALVGHYRAVADQAPVPLVLYNNPGLTGVDLGPPAVQLLAEHPNIVGIKESSGDVERVAVLASTVPSTCAVLVGAAPTFLASLAVGAVGGILAVACVVPDLCVRLYELVQAGRYDDARRVQQQLAPLARLVSSRFGVPGLKVALDLAGYVGGPPRPPLEPLAPDGVAEIERALRALEVRAAT